MNLATDLVNNCTDAFNVALGVEETVLIVLAPSAECVAPLSSVPFAL